MNIRRAVSKDVNAMNRLLRQVLTVHHNGRPDLFRANAKKYTDDELKAMLTDDARPVFVAVDDHDEVLGYVFCALQRYADNHILTDFKTLYIDDLCVDETLRGHQIGKQLYEFAVDYARREGCYNLTLNVWACNEQAIRFYTKCGLQPQKIGMEKIL